MPAQKFAKVAGKHFAAVLVDFLKGRGPVAFTHTRKSLCQRAHVMGPNPPPHKLPPTLQ